MARCDINKFRFYSGYIILQEKKKAHDANVQSNTHILTCCCSTMNGMAKDDPDLNTHINTLVFVKNESQI